MGDADPTAYCVSARNSQQYAIVSSAEDFHVVGSVERSCHMEHVDIVVNWIKYPLRRNLCMCVKFPQLNEMLFALL